MGAQPGRSPTLGRADRELFHSLQVNSSDISSLAAQPTVLFSRQGNDLLRFRCASDFSTARCSPGISSLGAQPFRCSTVCEGEPPNSATMGAQSFTCSTVCETDLSKEFTTWAHRPSDLPESTKAAPQICPAWPRAPNHNLPVWACMKYFLTFAGPAFQNLARLAVRPLVRWVSMTPGVAAGSFCRSPRQLAFPGSFSQQSSQQSLQQSPQRS